jgi:hypothetical protein
MQFYELSISMVDRSTDPVQSRNMGSLRWNVDALDEPPEELAAVDGLTIELMRAYVEDHDAKLEARKKRIAERKKSA